MLLVTVTTHTPSILPKRCECGDLVQRPQWSGIYYKKLTEVPFTGKTTGENQGSFRNGKKDGPWVKYHDNGQLWSKGIYKDGERDGPWVSYNEDGTVWKFLTGTYKDGVKVK